ncbi:MAG: HPr kinase/phosphatase C-terminal domain-containing protein [Alphaproteobacteria bacterium]
MSDRSKSGGPAAEATANEMTLHATCVALGDRGVLITGPSGSGKSDLALRLIDGGAKLVADDLTTLRIEDGGIIALAPPRLAGKLEVRGIGIMPVPSVPEVRLALAVALAPSAEIERLPEPEAAQYLGLTLPRVTLDPFAASAPAKVRLALAAAEGGNASDAR